MRKFLFFAGFLLFVSAELSTGCYYDNEEDLYGADTPCDTVNSRYSVEVLSIMQANCYSCHSQSSNSSGYLLDNYDNMQIYAENGGLHSRINSVSNPMPPTGLMSECDRQKIDAWINAGAKNN